MKRVFLVPRAIGVSFVVSGIVEQMSKSECSVNQYHGYLIVVENIDSPSVTVLCRDIEEVLEESFLEVVPAKNLFSYESLDDVIHDATFKTSMDRLKAFHNQ